MSVILISRFLLDLRGVEDDSEGELTHSAVSSAFFAEHSASQESTEYRTSDLHVDGVCDI